MEEIISYLLSPETIPDPIGSVLFILRIVFWVVSLVFLSIIVFVLFKSNRLKVRFFEDISEFATFKSYGTDKFTKEWKKIMKKLDSGLESEYKLAVIQADTMLDEVLQRIGHTEETIEEKLKATTPIEIGNLEDVKEARKTRNSIVYDPDYHLPLEKARESLEIYKKAFKDMAILS